MKTAQLAIIAVLFLSLSGLPQLAAQQAPPQQQQPESVMPDPAQGPLQPQPAPPEEQLPDAPSTLQDPELGPPAQADRHPETRSEPVGTAAAERAQTVGGAASKPAGTAIAPARQRQVRSFLIKLGAVAGVGLAVGTVYALTNRTPSTPPNTR